MPTFKSGAFAQQCYSSHPSSLTFKALTPIAPSLHPPSPASAETAASPQVHPPSPASTETAAVPQLHPPSPASVDPFQFGAMGAPDAAFPPAHTPTLNEPSSAVSPGPETAEMGSLPVYRIVVTCDTCDMRHRFVIGTLSSHLGQKEEAHTEAMSQLAQCAAGHPIDLRVSGMDVSNDSVRFRCGECHRTYDLVASAMETYQK